MQQLGARFYWPEIGRFVQQDPVRDGMNWYAYVSNGPTAYVDPEGRFIPVPSIVGGIAGFAGGFTGAWVQCPHDWKGAIGAGVVGGAIGFGTGFLGPWGGVAAQALVGGIAGAVGGGVGDFPGQGIGYWRSGSPGGFHPNVGSIVGAAVFGATGGAGGAAVSAAATAAAAGTATFGVWSDVAFAIGGTAISFGFNAFGGIWGAEAWKDLGGR